MSTKPAVQIGLDRGGLTPATASALVTAAMVTVVVLPGRDVAAAGPGDRERTVIDAGATDVQNPRVTTAFRRLLAVTTPLPTAGLPAAGCAPASAGTAPELR
ncbi:MAG: hypothetical protein L0I24_04985 [Pseudonocardia sp.]|nr:hypothetical protein [Pseudonocardia sp.]